MQTDQVRSIRMRGNVLSEVELEEIRRRVMTGREGNEGNETLGETGNIAESTENIEEPMSEATGLDRMRSDGVENTTRGNGEAPEDRILRDLILAEMENIRTNGRPCPPKVCRVDRSKLIKVSIEINRAMAQIETKDLSETNNLILAGATVCTTKLGLKTPGKAISKGLKKSPARRRIERDIMRFRKDLSRISELIRGQKQLKKGDYLQQRYNIIAKGASQVSEILKEKIKASTEKIKRYEERHQQYRQNRMFNENQKKFYAEMDGKNNCQPSPPLPLEATQFWSNIWGSGHEHNKEAEWIQIVQSELDHIVQQDDLSITTEMMRKVLSRMRPWKAPGPDSVQAYWIKTFTSLHERISSQMNSALRLGSVPKWMTSGRTILIPKDPQKGSVPSNFRPITCLPIMWKLLTGIISEHVFCFLNRNELMPWEQKGCGRGSRGAKHHLLIDKAVMTDSRSRKRNLAMGWIDYKKAYDMVPHSWIKQILTDFKVAGNSSRLLTNSMECWSTRLETLDGSILGEIGIKRGIFQGDSLSPLLFVMALIPLTILLRRVKSGYSMAGMKINHLLYMDDLKVYARNRKEPESIMNTVRVFSQDIGMEFGLEKCAIVLMKRGRLEETSDMMLPNGGEIKAMGTDSQYRYLGVLEADTIRNAKVRTTVAEEYKHRLVRMLKSKLNAGNLFRAINTYAVAAVRYTAGIIRWTKEELETLDRMTRKKLTTYGGLHPRSDVDRLYVDRKRGGRGLKSIYDTVVLEEEQLAQYVRNSTDPVMQAVSTVLKVTASNRVRADRYALWKEKAMHGQFLKQTEDKSGAGTWMWLQRGVLKRATESLITAAQE